MFNTIRIYCNKFRAQIHYYVADYVSALHFVKKACNKIQGSTFVQIESLSHEESKLSREKERSFKSPRLQKGFSVLSAASSENAANYNSNLIQSLKQLQSDILESLHSQSSNLFTFMRACPIVSYNDSNESKLSSVSDKYRTKFPFVSTVKKRLSSSKHNL